MPLPAGTFFESMIFLFFRWDISDRSVGGYAKQSATNPGYILPSLNWNWGEHSPSLALKPVDMKAHRNTQMYKYTQIIHIYSSTGENGHIGKQIYIYILMNIYIYMHYYRCKCHCTAAPDINCVYLILSKPKVPSLSWRPSGPTKSTSDDHSWESEDTPAPGCQSRQES